LSHPESLIIRGTGVNLGNLTNLNQATTGTRRSAWSEGRRQPPSIKGSRLVLALQSIAEVDHQPAMNKGELIEAVQKALGKEATKRQAEDSVAAVLESIAKGVKKDKKVQIIGFGTFEVKKRAARMGRNPKTGEAMKIAASKSVGFKPSSTLKNSL
jgi:DNA-binding protein HU-beta